MKDSDRRQASRVGLKEFGRKGSRREHCMLVSRLLLKNRMPDGSEVCGRVVHISDLFSRHAFVEATIHSHDGLHRQIRVCCLFFCAICVVSLRDYPCHRPVRVVSSAAQAAAVVPPVRRHGEMLRLINRRQFCLNIPP